MTPTPCMHPCTFLTGALAGATRAAPIVLMLAGIGCGTLAAQQQPPAAPVRPVAETWFDTTVVDPYRWMEDLRSDEATEWLKAQDVFARAYLGGLPRRAGLVERIPAASRALGTPAHSYVRAAGKHFYIRQVVGTGATLFVRDTDGAERALLNVAAYSTPEQRRFIRTFEVSPDGRLLAVTLPDAAYEDLFTVIIDTESGAEIGERLLSLWIHEWLPDSRTAVLLSLPELHPDVPVRRRFANGRLVRLRAGEPHTAAALVFGPESAPELDWVSDPPSPRLILSAASEHAFVRIARGADVPFVVYSSSRAAVESGTPQWRRIADEDAEVHGIHLHGDDLYLLTTRGGTNYRLVRTSAGQPDIAGALELDLSGHGVISGLGLAEDALYVNTMHGGIDALLRIQHRTRHAESVPLPMEASIVGLSVSPHEPGALFQLTSWTVRPAAYGYDPTTRTVSALGLSDSHTEQFNDIEVTRVQVPSHDGTLVPLTILHRRGLELDGRHPTILNGYGAFGVAIKPATDWRAAEWVRQGGVFAYPHVRGGGEFGREWHVAGKAETKSNSWKDLIACAEYLVAEGYTSPARLAALGASAGGLLVGRAITERPELFGAAVIEIGVLNTLQRERSNSYADGEYGSPHTPEGFRALLANDAYHHVRDGVAYPAVLLTHGSSDPNVQVWHSMKFAARLQATSTSDRPVLLRVSFGQGHGTQASDYIDIFAFLLEQLGAYPVR
jgi:prolyl oligopeptidase